MIRPTIPTLHSKFIPNTYTSTLRAPSFAFKMTTLLIGLQKFIGDMGSLHWPIQIWASLFPFPQLIVGSYLTVTRGVGSPASWILASRVASFVVAGQECVFVAHTAG